MFFVKIHYLFCLKILLLRHNSVIMAKAGKQKNTQNKAKHAKLMARKKNKIRREKEERAARLKALVQKMHQQQKDQENV